MKDKRPTFEIRQGAFIFNEKYQLLLLKNKKGTWGIVWGHLEYNENPEEGLLREIKEETNIEVRLLRIFDTVIRNKDFILIYVAKHIKEDLKLSPEHVDWKWIDVDSLGNLKLTFPELKDEAKRALSIYLNQD